MKGNKVVGIDIGLNGGIAIYDIRTKELNVFEMPVKKKENKRILDIKKLISLFDTINSDIILVGVEKQHPFPKEGVKSVYSLGYQVGVIETILNIIQSPYVFVEPKDWKKNFNLKGKKRDKESIKKSYGIVKNYFKNRDFYTKRKKLHTGKIDACLILLYILERKVKISP